MKAVEQRKEAFGFVKRWRENVKNKTEREITSSFWEDLLQNIYGVEYPGVFIDFEKKVRVPGEPKPKRIDGYIASTKVLIEQKSRGVNLDRKIEQSGGILLTPYEQAKRYADNLKNTERPDWIVVCNFEEFRIHNLNSERADEYQSVFLEDLPKEYHRLAFLQDITNTHIYKEVDVSRKAGKLIGEIYTELQKQYEILDERAMHELNVLCVRLVFCLFAEDAGIFTKNQFGNYLRPYSSNELQYKLHDLFTALGTTKRDNLFIDPRAKEFDYVNGGLFQDTAIGIPPITEEVKQLLVEKSSDNFNWENISPTIFGGIFEDTLNPETRHDGGMHYTSIENIHKVIDPLFLDDLKEELSSILSLKAEWLKKQRLLDFHKKLGSIQCLDPACGSGNFLTETYLSLRRIENVVIKARYGDGYIFEAEWMTPIVVSIGQFHGIELNDFAVSVAKTAMWIAEFQMRKETYSIVKFNEPYLPLKNYANIVKSNALRTDWNEVASAKKLSYIIGNPPFLGSSEQSEEQKDDLVFVLANGKKKLAPKELDYVAGWYTKTAQMMQKNPKIRAALVSTNSITQGEQVALMWKPLVERYGLWIDFAHRTFVWDGKANVHCVIIGFGVGERTRTPIIYDGETKIAASHINAYLMDYEDVWVQNRTSTLCDISSMIYGSKPTGNFKVTEKDRRMLQEKYPDVMPYIRRFVGATEFISNTPRYCFWLKDAPSSIVRKCPWLMERIEAIRNQRLSSTKLATRKKAESPMLFDEDRQPNTNYMIVPCHSSGNREYIPIGFMGKEVICGNANQLIPNATPYLFGILTSSLHMAWTNIIGGKIKSDPRYSGTIVYNNFPWIEATDEQKDKIAELAQTVLDVRKKREDVGDSLADMYDVKAMPDELRKAHRNLDRAVLKLYGLKTDAEEMDIVRHLLGLYKNLSEVDKKKPRRGE